MTDEGGEAIGDWRFHAAEDELRRPGERRKLEHRAARTLELLCAHRGGIVSRETILEAVWQGRSVSPNSVAIVISDLREALGDAARSPRHIETVAKRGYRLHAEAAPPPVPAGLRRWPIAVTLLLIVAAVAGWALIVPRAAPALAVAEVADQTGDPRYGPLARASSAVLLSAAQHETGVIVVQSGRGSAPVLLQARLIMWSGKPTLMMSASDAAGKLIWSGMTRGGEDVIPGDVTRAMRDLRGRLAGR